MGATQTRNGLKVKAVLDKTGGCDHTNAFEAGCSGKHRKGTLTVRRMTIRKRMRAKLQQIKQQLRRRMHDPVAQTRAWLKSVLRVTSTTRYQETSTASTH